MAATPDVGSGVAFSGSEDDLQFLRPYRHIGRLNPVERLKLDRHPFAVAEAVAARYATEGVEALMAVPGELERLKWVGLYPQRQGGDAFMLRVKVPGGLLTSAQARAIGAVAEECAVAPTDSPAFGNCYADLTTRQSIQLHWLHLADIPAIWRRFDAVGLTTVQACGDCARNVTCCPVSGIDPHEVVDARGVAVAISAFFTGNRVYANLPRKFKIGVTGCVEDCARVEIDDVGLWPARAADGSVGFNVLCGGGLSDGERMASDIDVFVDAHEAVELTRGVARLFGELGNREHRGLARMRYLVQELGPEEFRAELAARVGFSLRSAGEELTRRSRGDHVGVHPQRQAGLSYVGCCVPVGRLRGRDLVDAARLAEEYGDGTVRLAPDQNFVLSGVPAGRVDDLLGEELLRHYPPDPGPFTRGVLACTGSEFCRYGVVETKERALGWARRLDARLAALAEQGGGEHRPLVGEVLRVHFSGCSASCAQPQIADIGLRGSVAHGDERLEEAADVGVGGSLGPEAGFLRWVSGALPLEQVPDAIVHLSARFVEQRRDGEPFARWARRQSVAQLREIVEEAFPE